MAFLVGGLGLGVLGTLFWARYRLTGVTARAVFGQKMMLPSFSPKCATSRPCRADGQNMSELSSTPPQPKDAIAVYRHLLRTMPGADIILSGDSAGGGMAAAMMQRLEDLQLPAPACCILTSPWTDLGHNGMRNATLSNEHLDFLSRPRVREGQKWPCSTQQVENPKHADSRGPLTWWSGAPPWLAAACTTMTGSWPSKHALHVSRTFLSLKSGFVPGVKSSLQDPGIFLGPAATSTTTGNKAPFASSCTGPASQACSHSGRLR